MKQFSRVLAAVDFSKPARGAFEYALALSKQHGAELVVVQAVPRNQAFSWHARERRALTAKLQRRADQANVEFKDRIQQGDPAEIILSHARSLRADVIVAGTHQRRGIDRFTDGSVAERIAAKATVPVLLIPWHRHADTIRPFSHVAVAIDFSTARTVRSIRRWRWRTIQATASRCYMWCLVSRPVCRRTCTATESQSTRTS